MRSCWAVLPFVILGLTAPGGAAAAPPADPPAEPVEAPAPAPSDVLAPAPQPAETAAVAPPGALTLPAATAEALQSSPIMAAARENVAVFEAQLTQAEWAWFPQGKIEASIAPTPAKRGDAISGYTDFRDWGPMWKVRVDGALPLYTFGRIAALKEAAAAGVDVAEAVRDVAAAEVRFRVQQAWWGWQLGRDMEDIVAEGRTYVEKARKRLERMEAEDSAEFDQIDLLRLRVYTADVETLYVTARRMQTVALHGMALLLGRDGQEGVTATEPQVQLVDVDLEPVDVALGGLDERLQALAGSQPAVRAADRGAVAMQSVADAKWAELYPDLFLGAYFSYAGSTVADPQDSPFAHDPWNSWTGGAALGVRYQLDVPQRVARARQASEEADRTLWLGRIAVAEIALEAETAHREAADLAELLPTYRRAERAARSWLVAKSDLYDAGFASLDDVTDALVEFFKRRLGHLRAVHDYNLAVARLSRALGADLDEPPPAAPPAAPDAAPEAASPAAAEERGGAG